MIDGVGFIWPWAWALWAGIVLVTAIVSRSALRIRREAASFLGGQVQTFSGQPILLLLSIILAIGTARPYWGERAVSISGVGRDIVLVLDVSMSMTATDVSPSRLEVMQRKMGSLLEISSKDNSLDRFGIVAFAGAAAPICPLTTDRSVVLRYVRALTQGVITSPGSGIEEGLRSALDMIERSGGPGASIILVSDGEGPDDGIKSILHRARSQGVIISSLGLGTEEGSLLYDSRGGQIRDSSGKVVRSTLRKSTLCSIAEGSGGICEMARVGTGDISRLFLSLNRTQVSNGPRGSSVRLVRNEITHWFAFASLFLLLLSAIRTPEVLLPLLLFAIPRFAAADVESAVQYFREGDFDRSGEEFERLLAESPEDARLLHGAGSAAYRRGDYHGAARYFDRAAKAATHPREKFEALFNLGNAKVKGGKPREAIDHYDAALLIKPQDRAAMQNRAVAAKMMERPTPTPESSPSPNADSPSSNPPSDSDTNLDQDTADSSQHHDRRDEPEGEKEASSQEQEREENDSVEERRQEDGREGQTENVSDADDGNVARHGAEAWLDSLPEAPLLMKREKTHRGRQGGQTW